MTPTKKEEEKANQPTQQQQKTPEELSRERAPEKGVATDEEAKRVAEQNKKPGSKNEKENGPEFEDEMAENYTAQADPIVSDSFLAQVINTELEGAGKSPTLETLRDHHRREWRKENMREELEQEYQKKLDEQLEKDRKVQKKESKQQEQKEEPKKES